MSHTLAADAPLPLRRQQVDTVGGLVARMVVGLRRALVVLPTGAGKTVAFAAVPGALRTHGFPIRRTLILAHREELLAQAKRTLAGSVLPVAA